MHAQNKEAALNSLERAFEDFKPDIDALIEDINGYTWRSQHPSYIGQGLNDAAFLLVKDGSSYVVRALARGNIFEHTDIRTRLDATLISRGYKNFEQVKAVSRAEGRIVTEYIEGYDLERMPLEDIGKITLSHIEDFIDELRTAGKIGLTIDPKHSNFIHNQETGIHIIDTSARKTPPPLTQTIEQVTRAFCLAGGGATDLSIAQTVEDFAYQGERSAANLPLIRMFREACLARLNDEELQEVMPYINSVVAAHEQEVAKLTSKEGQLEAVTALIEAKRKISDLYNEPITDEFID